MTEEELQMIRKSLKELTLILCNLVFTIDDILKNNEHKNEKMFVRGETE